MLLCITRYVAFWLLATTSNATTILILGSNTTPCETILSAHVVTIWVPFRGGQLPKVEGLNNRNALPSIISESQDVRNSIPCVQLALAVVGPVNVYDLFLFIYLFLFLLLTHPHTYSPKFLIISNSALQLGIDPWFLWKGGASPSVLHHFLCKW
eukprot:TRINITY_DN39514_c4_g1_i1.p2 TRINITY_DN39514_c4_g1~~TRINITY_DN39514_c4_g1_i1.p2  ORF type:complete len:154 (-),score=3.16 TRINITY_DN39514_c4_g1_i1:344-805(-)